MPWIPTSPQMKEWGGDGVTFHTKLLKGNTKVPSRTSLLRPNLKSLEFVNQGKRWLLNARFIYCDCFHWEKHPKISKNPILSV